MNTLPSFAGFQHPPHTSEQLLARLAARYDVAEKRISVGGSDLLLLCVRDTNLLVDAIDPATFAADERLPYWADLWASSLGLAEWCLTSRALRDRKVLELGCGLGLAGIAAALAGASVLLTDYEDDALAFARCNAMRNLPPDVFAGCVQFQRLDWRNPAALDKVDVVIAADVVYERRNFSPLLSLIGQVLLPGGAAVFADPDRSIGREFLDAAGRTCTVSTGTRTVTLNGTVSTIVLATLHPLLPVWQ